MTEHGVERAVDGFERCDGFRALGDEVKFRVPVCECRYHVGQSQSRTMPTLDERLDRPQPAVATGGDVDFVNVFVCGRRYHLLTVRVEHAQRRGGPAAQRHVELKPKTCDASGNQEILWGVRDRAGLQSFGRKQY